MDLGILNTVIALVIVLLVLSLLVQAVQTLIKKLLKLKSKQIQGSLKDLYEQAIAGTAATTTPPAPAPNGGANASSAAEVFTGKVLEEFKKIGRVTLFGNPVLDSLSKEDLFKVMGKLESQDFFPDYVTKFQVLCDQIIALRQAIESLAGNTMLRGAASSRLAEMRSILAPIFNNVQAILDGTQVKPNVLFADLLRLGKLDVRNILKLLDEAQTAIAQEKELASQAGAAGEVTQLQNLSNELTRVALLIGDLSQKYDDAVSPLRGKIEQVEIWFDTVTQSFDERYARNMRTASILISIVIVIVLNASFFRVYKSISTNEVQKNLIVESGPAVLERARQARTQPSPVASPAAATSPALATFPAPETSPAPATSPASATSPAPATYPASAISSASNAAVVPPPPVNVKDEIEKSRQEMAVLTSTYEGFGFSPLSVQQIDSFLWSIVGYTLVRNEKGVVLDAANKEIPADCRDCQPAWRSQNGSEWWASRRGDVVTLVGWAIMVMLLSVGAPFWQDTLESLFGIKNLLRQKSGTQNIETQSGTGQPKE
ncbi:MAG: hypothetical protein LC794_03755 [Acidobacteria bacterium]|nr:hypothetical protein [Acidobacteriota bacterium]